MAYVSVAQASEALGISARRVQQMCRSGELVGAVKEGHDWKIPESSVTTVSISGRGLKKFPIGISNFKTASTQYYYVDKTLLIKDFLDTLPQVSLFTRPRRFGKSLNMDMMKTFFEISEEDTSVYFKNLKIWGCGDEYCKYQGKYPVIYITLKDVKLNTWQDTLIKLKELIAAEFARHTELQNSDKITEYERIRYHRIIEGTADSVVYEGSLSLLSSMLHEHFGVAPVIIIDEYDVPIQQGYFQDFYADVVSFLRNFFSSGLKDNPHLSFALMTGVLRVAKESIFSGMNNLVTYSIFDQKYSQYFGFTKDETLQVLKDYRCEDRFDEVCEWYDGYNFGGTEIINPWSVLNYISSGCVANAYWQSTGSNELIGEALAVAGEDTWEDLNALLQGKSVFSSIDANIVYPEAGKHISNAFSFMLLTGYLRIDTCELSGGNYMCEISIPNQEIAYVYAKEILDRFSDTFHPSTATDIQEALFQKNFSRLQDLLRKFMLETISSFDYANEAFYHGMTVGLFAIMNGSYWLESNREAGDGRLDILLMPKSNGLPGIIVEIKACKDESEMERYTKIALDQVEDRQYDVVLKGRGVTHIIKLGMAFCGKQVKIESIEQN